MESFDDIYGFKSVFHLPALTDKKYALRNWIRNKRFVLWDEFAPVQYAHEGVFPVTQFLKAFNGHFFEIQLPQNAHDGNVDFKWNRGVVFTGKEDGLWMPTNRISPEDIKHMKSRV
eukprot:9848798-Karenia_brevis.AAC.1